MCIYTYVCMYVYIYVYMYTYMYVCMYIYIYIMYVYIYIYIFIMRFVAILAQGTKAGTRGGAVRARKPTAQQWWSSEAYKRDRIKRGCSQKPDLRIGGKSSPRNMYR